MKLLHKSKQKTFLRLNSPEIKFLPLLLAEPKAIKMKDVAFEKKNTQRYFNGGTEKEYSEITLNGTLIMCFISVPAPLNFMASIKETYVPDILITKGSSLARIAVELGGVLSDAYYTPENILKAEFKTFENTLQFIKEYKSRRGF